jgi:hypothetical protein
MVVKQTMSGIWEVRFLMDEIWEVKFVRNDGIWWVKLIADAWVILVVRFGDERVLGVSCEMELVIWVSCGKVLGAWVT